MGGCRSPHFCRTWRRTTVKLSDETGSNEAQKVELFLSQRVIHSVCAAETSDQGRWLSQSKHVISNF